MSDTRPMWSFAHQQSADSAPYYTSNPYKPRQNPRRHFHPAGTLPTVAEIADPEHLIATYYAIKSRGGWAAGPDGTSYPDLGASEVANLMRELSQIVLDGSYCHGPTRAQEIAKLRGGTRTLQIANLCDRVLSAAIHGMMTPFWETVFMSWSMGCRPFPRGPLFF